MEEITAMLSDDEDDDRLYTAEDIPELMLLVNSNAREPNATDTSTSRNFKENITHIANNEQTIRNNADTLPDDIDSLLKNFNSQQVLKNNPHIFDESYEEKKQGKEQIESNGARVICKDFARIPFDDDSNLLTREYSHLVDDTPTTTAMSVADVSRNNEMSNKVFRPRPNNFNNNARCASDALKQLSQDAYRAAPQMISPNADYENADFDLNGFDVIGNPSTGIPMNSGYGIQAGNMRINTPAAQNLNVFMPHPGGLSSTAYGTDVFSNSDRLNASRNNFGSFGPVPAPPHQSQDLYSSEAHRRQMHSHNLAAPSANYGQNMSACQYARCMRPCAPKIMRFTPTPALPAGYIPRPLCICPGPCNLHITGPFYPAVQPSFQAQPNIQTTAPLNVYGQALNGNSAIPQDGLYRVEAPIMYATYQEASNTTRAYAEINPNLSNGGVINVGSSLPANTITYHSTTTSFGWSNNMAQNWDTFCLKNTVKYKRQTKTTKKTPKTKTKAVKKAPRARATKITKDHFQLMNANVETHADKQNENLRQPRVEMRLPAIHGDVKFACNKSDANIMQAPLKHDRHLDAIHMAMQTNEQQTGIHNVTENFQSSMSTETYKQDSLIGSVDNSVALLNMNKCGAVISRTPISEQLKTPTPFNTFEGNYNIESIDRTADSITFNPTTQLRMETSTRHDKMSMNINNVQTPKTQHAGMSINSENAQIPLIVGPSSQYADKLQPKMQQASMNRTTNSVQTLITEDNTTQQDNVYKIVATAEAPYIKTCEPLKSELQISGAVIQARNSSDLPFTAAKKLEHDSAEFESKTNYFIAETSTPLDKTYLANKAQAPIKCEHSKINTNEYLQKYKKEEMLITTANPREDMKKHTIQAAVINTISTTIPTNVNQVKMGMSTETVQTSMNTEVCIQSANKNSNVQSPQPIVPLNKNTEKEDVALYTLEARKRKMSCELAINASKKLNRCKADIKLKNNYTSYSRPVQKSAAKTDTKFHQAYVGKNKKETNSKSIVKLPFEMLKPSTVDSVIKLKHNTFAENSPTLNIAPNDIDNKDKHCIINREEQTTNSAKTATSTSNPPDKNLNTTINKNHGNVDNNTENPVTIENANINTNIERSREVSSLNDVEIYGTTQLSNKVMNTENTVNIDNNKNKISRKVRKSLSVETATSSNVVMYEKNRNTETNNNREMKNLKNRKSRGKNHEDTANRPNVEPKPKKSNSDAQKNTDSKINKYSASYRVSKTTEKLNKIRMKFKNLFGESDDDESQITNDNKDKNDNRGSETEDDTKSSSETDDDVNEAISNSFNTLKNNSNEKSELPEVHISGKTKGKISNKHKNDAKVKNKYKCHVCSALFHYPRVYFRHMMENHGIHNERVPEDCKFLKCSFCGMEYLQGYHNTHLDTWHNDIFNKKI